MLVSCRYPKFKDYHKFFRELNFSYLLVNPFDKEQIRQYLKTKEIEQKKINQVFENLKTIDTIQVPRYLALFASLLKEEVIDPTQPISRNLLMEKFILKALVKEDETFFVKKKELFKRILEKLSLVMGINQTRKITKKEFMTFLDDVDSNLITVFMQAFSEDSLSYFYERGLLKENYEKDTLEFNNVEFQDYLASQELKRMGKVDQRIFDLMVDIEYKEFNSFWLECLDFLIENNQDLIEVLVKYIKTYPDALSEPLCEKLVLNPVENSNLKKDIFKLVFDFYQNRNEWIRLANRLTFFFEGEDNQEDLLKTSLNKIDGRTKEGYRRFIVRGNVASIIGALLKDNKSDIDEDFWKGKLKDIIKDDSKEDVLKTVMQRKALYALASFEDFDLLKAVEEEALKNPELKEIFLNFCREFNANDTSSIDLFLDHICYDTHYSRIDRAAFAGINSIDSHDGILYLLDELFKNKNGILEHFLRAFSGKYDDSKVLLIENINEKWNEEIENKVKELVIPLLEQRQTNLSDNLFLREILKLLANKDETYPVELLNQIDKSKVTDFVKYFEIPSLFSTIINETELPKIKEQLEELETFEQSFFQHLKSNVLNNKSPQISEEKVTQCESHLRDLSDQDLPENDQEAIQHCQDFFDFLDKQRRFYKLIEADKKKIKSKLSKIMRSDCIKSIEEKNSLKTTKLQVLRKCIKECDRFDIDLKDFKAALIEYLPYATSNELVIIFEKLEASEVEEELLSRLKDFAEKNQDFYLREIILSCKRAEVQEAIPVLKEIASIASSEDFDVSTRESALLALSSLNCKDQTFYTSIFEKYKTPDVERGLFSLAEISNQILIDKFEDKDAIEWRIQEIKKRVIPISAEESSGSGAGVITAPASTKVSEIYEKTFAKPLMELTSENFQDEFIGLLDGSLSKLEENKKYFTYVKYMWEIGLKYFENIKVKCGYSTLNKLEEIVQDMKRNMGKLRGFSHLWRKYRIFRRKYITHLSKPEDFFESIKKYNEMKSRQYLRLSSDQDLFYFIKEAIDEDIRSWIEDEGNYDLLKYKWVVDKEEKDSKKKKIDEDQTSNDNNSDEEKETKQHDQREVFFQKIFKNHLKAVLIEKGIRNFDIAREEELDQGLMVDFLVRYGHLGPILIEVKRTNNKQVSSQTEREEYIDKLRDYLKGTHSTFGIYLLIRTNPETEDIIETVKTHRELYTDTKIAVIGLNCISR